jgi:hypothetical protein
VLRYDDFRQKANVTSFIRSIRDQVLDFAMLGDSSRKSSKLELAGR